MYLKQKLKQKINLALFKKACFGPLLSDTARGWYSTQKDNRRECINEYQRKIQMLRTIQGAADYLSVSRSTVYRLIDEGKLKRVYLRGAPRITESSLVGLAGESDG